MQCHAISIPHKKESLIELCCDSTLQSRQKKVSLSQFWMSLENEYSYLTHKAIKLLRAFLSSYLYEKSFSRLALVKTKQRNCLNADAELRVSETSLMPVCLVYWQRNRGKFHTNIDFVCFNRLTFCCLS